VVIGVSVECSFKRQFQRGIKGKRRCCRIKCPVPVSSMELEEVVEEEVVEEVVEENELDDDCAKFGQPSEFKT
jgi:hypothetical protein